MSIHPSKKRVLILEAAGNLWGSERFLLDFLRALPNQQWDIGVCCPPSTPIIKELSKLPVRIFPNFISNLHLKSKLSRLIALINLFLTILHFKPKLIYLNQAGVIRLALIAGKLTNTPVIITLMIFEEIEYVRSLKVTIKNVPKIILASKYLYNIFTNNDVITTKQSELIYYSYIPRFRTDDESLKVPMVKKGNFACVGRLAYTKGQDIVLFALAELKKMGITANVTFIGSAGPGDLFDEKLYDLAEELEVEDRVKWLGFKEDVFSFCTDSVSWICPSGLEPFGRVILEAWDAGAIPIACKDSGGPAEIINASAGGILYDKQNGASLAEAMVKVMNLSISERMTMVKNGRVWFENNCNPESNSRKISNIWEEVINK